MRYLRNGCLFFAAFIMSGCAVYMAAHQPGTRNLELMKIGTERDALIAEFDLPITTYVRSNKTYEIFKFTNGYSAWGRAARAVFHAAADVVTLALWEIAATPTEGYFTGDVCYYRVSYDDQARVATVVDITNHDDDEWAKRDKEATNRSDADFLTNEEREWQRRNNVKPP